jgi:hypothetical protein
MKVYSLDDMQLGYFIGNFEPSVFKSKEFEVGYKFHKQGEAWPNHYQKTAIEINLLVRGSMIVNGVTLHAKQIFTFDPKEPAKPVFLTDCEVVVVKVPSVGASDKVIVDE